MTMRLSISLMLKSVSALTLTCGVCSQAYTETQTQGLSYSTDQWPKRWSSAIRQQQNGDYPTRQLRQTPPPDLPEEGSVVSEHDLFYSPHVRSFGERRRDRRQRHKRFDEEFSSFREFRDARREARKGAFAYHGMPALNYGSVAGPYSSFPYGTAPLGIDPVLGHPGIGIPIMPGTPYGYPFIGYPFAGYPGGLGMWNPPFGVW